MKAERRSGYWAAASTFLILRSTQCFLGGLQEETAWCLANILWTRSRFLSIFRTETAGLAAIIAAMALSGNLE